MINEIGKALTRLLRSEIVGKPELEISFRHPSQFESKGPSNNQERKPEWLNLYLHEITENAAIRQDPFQITRKPGETSGLRKRPHVRMNLVYTMTAHCGDVERENQLLTLALGALLRNPYIPAQYLDGNFPQMDPLLSVAQEPSASTANTDLWRALGCSIRPSLSLHVVAPFDPFQSDKVEFVREMIVGLGFLHDRNEAGRPHDVRGLRVSVAGVVFDQDLVPLPGAVVSVEDRNDTAVCDDRGFFYLVNLPPGSCRLKFHRRGYAAAELQAKASSAGLANEIEPLVVQLIRLSASDELALLSVDQSSPLVDVDRTYPVTVAGRLLLQDGRPAAYVPVRLGDQRSVTDETGRYRFHSREKGDSVWATYPGIGEVAVVVAQGEGVVSKQGGT